MPIVAMAHATGNSSVFCVEAARRETSRGTAGEINL
jgi:hypothetical protein